MTRPSLRFFLFATTIFAVASFSPHHLAAQSYEHSPFYQSVASADGDAVMIRHASANGITADISVASSEGGWNEAVRTDGRPHHEMVHVYLQATDSSAIFAYDLLLEPVPGTHQIRCTFMQQASETFAEDKHSTQVVPLTGDLAPVLIDEGGTLAITMFADRDKKQRIVQYLHLRLSTAKEQAALTIPAIGQSCVRIPY